MSKRIALPIGIALMVIAGSIAGYYYHAIFQAEALKIEGDQIEFFIPSGANEIEVLNLLVSRAGLVHPEMAERVMNRKNYSGGRVVAGKYTLEKEMSLNALIDHLRSGNGEEEVDVTFTTSRTSAELSANVSRYIEADSTSLARALQDPEIARAYGFDPSTFITMFLPDTYRMEWDSDSADFLGRMAGEYKKYWNEDRKNKAGKIGLSQSEVSILASIVQAEQQTHPEERKVIAGLYLNRLRRGMRLQSDPTVVFALQDFSINRVLTEHLSVESPYNTYLNAGLTPGPILIPSKQSIDAVLNAEQHDYLYMCAKADFSGKHAFAGNLSEHNRNARAFQRALNERQIYR